MTPGKFHGFIEKDVYEHSAEQRAYIIVLGIGGAQRNALAIGRLECNLGILQWDSQDAPILNCVGASSWALFFAS